MSSITTSSAGNFDFSPPAGENPLVPMIARAVKHRSCPIQQESLKKFRPFAARIITHLATPDTSLAAKLAALPGVGALAPRHTCDKAVHSVIALALLMRLDEYEQQAKEARKLKRDYENASGDDLLAALRREAARGSTALIGLVTREAREFLPYADPVELENSIRERLPDIKRLL